MTRKVPQDHAFLAASADERAVSPEAADIPPVEQGDDDVLLPKQQPANATGDAIRLLAYEKWQTAGCPAGDGFHFWLEAEQDLNMQRLDASQLTATSPSRSTIQ